MKRPFAVIGFTVFLTIAFLFDKNTGVTVTALAVFSVALVIALFSKKLREAKAVAFFSVSGAVACVFLLVLNSFFCAPLASYAGSAHRLKAQINDEAVLEYGNYYYNAKVLTVDGNDVGADIRLVFSDMTDIGPYDIVEGDFFFYRPGISNSAILNANLASGLVLGAYPMSDELTVIRLPENEKPFGMKIIRLRNEIKRAVFRAFPNEKGALAVAMILGDKAAISDELYNNLRLSGIVHIICVSGFHLSLWAMMIIRMLRKIGLRERLASVVAAAGVIGFMLLTGLTYSVLRAGIMMLAYLFACFISRKSDSLNSLGFSLLVISVISPYAMASVSLQLSALSTLGILLYHEFVYPEFREKFSKNTRSKRILFSVLNPLFVTMSATLLIQPVMLRLSGDFSFASVISNMIITPFAGGAITLSALAAAASFFIPKTLNVFRYPAELFLGYIISVSELMADADFLRVQIAENYSYLLIGVVLMFFAAAVALSCRMKLSAFAASVIACALFFSGIITTSLFQSNKTEIRVIDTGNGISVLFSDSGENLLVGCGGTSFSGEYVICDAVNRAGSFDYLVLPSAEETSAAYAVDVVSFKRPDNIYYDELPDNVDLLLNGIKKHSLSHNYSGKNFSVSFYEINSENFVLVKTENISSLICPSPIESLAELPSEFRNADLMITRNDYPSDIADYSFGFTVICAENARGLIIQKELDSTGVVCAATGGCGDLVITAENGDMSVRRE